MYCINCGYQFLCVSVGPSSFYYYHHHFLYCLCLSVILSSKNKQTNTHSLQHETQLHAHKTHNVCNDGRKWPFVRSLASLCWPSACLCVSIFLLLGSCITPSPGDAVLARDGILKCPAMLLPWQPGRKKKTKKGKKEAKRRPKCLHVFLCFFYLFSEPHHQLDESWTCRSTAISAAECVNVPVNLPQENKWAGVCVCYQRDGCYSQICSGHLYHKNLAII